MPISNEEAAIQNQLNLLQAHRRTLAHYLMQQAKLGQAFMPPGVSHGIWEAREAIRHSKEALARFGVPQADMPNDLGTTVSGGHSIRSATTNETVVIIAPFTGRLSQFVIHPEWHIRDALTTQIQLLNEVIGQLRIEEWSDSIRDQSIAREIAAQYGATLLIWGRYDDIAGIQVFVEIMRDVPQADIQLGSNWLALGGMPLTDSLVAGITQTLRATLPAMALYLATVALGMITLVQCKPSAAERCFAAAIEAHQHAPIAEVPIHYAYYWRALARTLQEHYPDAINDLAYALELQPTFALALSQRGIVELALGDAAAAEGSFQQALALLPDRDRLGRAKLYNNIGQAQEQQDHLVDARHSYVAAGQLATHGIDPLTHAQTMIGLGSILQRSGDHDSALVQYQAALEFCQQISLRQGQIMALSAIGLLYYQAGQLSAALNYFLQAYQIADLLQSVGSQAQQLLRIGVVVLDRQQFEQADTLFRRALTYFEAAASVSGQAQAYVCLALLADQQGQNSALVFALEHAYTLFSRIHSPNTSAVHNELAKFRA